MPNLRDDQELRERYAYDPATGVLVVRSLYNRRVRIGDEITAEYISFRGRKVVKSRAIWCWYYGVWPSEDLLVDHKDGNHFNNRIKNLRLATKSQNAMNMGSRRDGLKGVYRVGNRWAAAISINGKRTHLGCFDTEEQAACAYKSAAEKIQGEFACHL